MLLIYSDKTSPRLQYICRFIFEEILGVSYSVTLHENSFLAHDGGRINYSRNSMAGAYQIFPSALLFEAGIQELDLQISGTKADTILFKNAIGDHPFDLFAAVFFLISRYEEYLPYTRDDYGRYPHTASAAFKSGFLDQPLINNWIRDFSYRLSRFNPTVTFKNFGPGIAFLPTYDIDMAWSYRQKGLLRNAAGFLRKPSLSRIASLLHLSIDPFDCYEFLDQLHRQYRLSPLYFFLVAKRNGKYDKNILPADAEMQKLVKEHAAQYNIGLHPSWQSNSDEIVLAEEKQLMEDICAKAITQSRQHYIKFTLPHTFRALLKAGITDDYSMGYGSINGFRASVASSFYWYDLADEKATQLRIHPFCFMDANCFYEQKLSLKESYDELIHYYNMCKNVQGTLITIFHNNFLGSDPAFQGWNELYMKFISQVQSPEHSSALNS